MKRKQKRKHQKKMSNIGNWLKRIGNMPTEYSKLVNENFWELLAEDKDNA